MSLFTIPQISKTEEDIVIAAFKEPAVRKYLQVLAVGIGSDIVFSQPLDGQNPEEYLRKIAQAQGKIHLLTILQKIGEETEQPST